jgi:methionyl-tRNA formyltransferase
MKVIFAGTPDFARVALAALIAAGHQIVAVYTQPDRPAGRGLAVKASPVKELALTYGIRVEQPKTLKDASAQSMLASIEADVMVVAAYGLILPEVVLNMPPMGCINIHGSLLPRWRGAAPIVRAIETGDVQTGICIMQMDVGLDTGAVISEHIEPILPTDTASTLHDRLAALGARAICQALGQAVQFDRPLPSVAQPQEGATYAAKVSKSEALIDWRQSAQTIVNRVRAFDPFPGSVAFWRGEPVKIWSANLPIEHQALVGNHLDLTSFEPGSVVAINPQSVVVRCGIGVQIGLIELTAGQKPGGKRLSGAAFMQAMAPALKESFEKN